MLEDNLDEDKTIKGEKIIFHFDNKKAKERFVNRLTKITQKTKLVKSEGYLCGHCAAYPCFRNNQEDHHAGLCFQPTRQCAQECNFYNHKGFPANGGTCRIDHSQVNYEEGCHISYQKTQNKKR